MTKKITHFGIVVNDADAACDLWCNSFGMKKAADMRIAEEGVRSVFISVDGTRDGMSTAAMEGASMQGQLDQASKPYSRRSGLPRRTPSPKE